jgi:hypothetical protein
MTLDAHGQPKNRAFNAARINDRVIDELIGVCRGVLADGEVQKSEAKFLIDWMDSNRQAAEQWPARVLYPRIQEMLSDSVLDPQEEGELMDLLVEITGGNANVVERVASLAGTLPLDDPAPAIHFEGKSFCFTGTCVAGLGKNARAW